MNSEEKQVMQEAKVLYKKLQKKSDVVLISSDDEIFNVSNHDNGNFIYRNEFIPVTGASNFIEGYKYLTFDEMLSKVTFGELQCKNCPFRKTLAFNEYGCSILKQYKTMHYNEMNNVTQMNCPLKIYRKEFPIPEKFSDIEE